jgi:hypothetical protein
VAGRHLDQAAAAAGSIGHGARGRRIDVTVPSSIAAALDGVSVVSTASTSRGADSCGPPSSTALRTRTSPRT